MPSEILCVMINKQQVYVPTYETPFIVMNRTNQLVHLFAVKKVTKKDQEKRKGNNNKLRLHTIYE